MPTFICVNKKCDSAQRRHGMTPCIAFSQHEEAPPDTCMHGHYKDYKCPFLLLDEQTIYDKIARELGEEAAKRIMEEQASRESEGV